MAEKALKIPKGRDPLEFLLAVMDDDSIEPRLRVRAAVAAAQYKHTKRGDGGKKDEQKERAQKAGRGRLRIADPPKLVAVK